MTREVGLTSPHWQRENKMGGLPVLSDSFSIAPAIRWNSAMQKYQ